MIINADDFGYSENVNCAVAEAFKRGLVNRATIMVNMPGFADAVKIAKDGGFFDKVGLHVNLTEGRAVTRACRGSALCDKDGNFKGEFHKSIIGKFKSDNALRDIIYIEIEAQIKKYIEMGFTLMHADSHQYVHTYPCVAEPFVRAIEKYGFRSVRISRNIPKSSFSTAVGVYKAWYNKKMRRIKNGHGVIETKKYFGSVKDFEAFAGSVDDYDNAEIMTHPVFKGDVLYDDTLPSPHEFIDRKWLERYGIKQEDVSKTKLLVTFVQTHIGGAMTSLVNFLNALDLDKYDVDVMFYEDTRGGRWGIKEGINILPQGKTHRSLQITNVVKKMLSVRYVIAKIREQYYLKVERNKRKAVQVMSREGCRYSRRLDKTYDVAVSYEFSWCMYYTERYVKAAKKLLWHHLDYHAAERCFKMDKKTFDGYDKMVFVSDEIMKRFVAAHLMYDGKCFFMPNLLSSEFVRQRGEEEAEIVFERDNDEILYMISVARLSFPHKGYDRGIEILKRLREEKLIDKVRWLVVGDGSDSDEFNRMIEENCLSESVKRVGRKDNAIPYMKQADVLFLPSRFEGKPMAVTEAQIMGLMPLVSRYSSADEQIKSGFDGIVTDNNTDALYEAVRSCIVNPEMVKEIRENISRREYGNTDEIRIFDNLVI